MQYVVVVQNLNTEGLHIVGTKKGKPYNSLEAANKGKRDLAFSLRDQDFIFSILPIEEK